jgi:iron complex outermembrane receptor protein
MKSLLLASTAALLALPALALAAPVDDQAAREVSSVIVTARPDPEDPPVVAAARRRLSETPGGVSVISQESYANRQALALDDMLRDAPGVYAQRKWGGDVRLSIRGSGIGNASHNRGLLLAQDGVPLNEADGYGDSQVADPLNTRFTEVYRGGNALRFGGALLGGAINMVTPTGKDAGFAEQVRLDGGSFGLLREHVALARQSGDWDVYAAATNQTSQGWRSQSQQNLQFGSLNIGRGFGQDREVRLVVNGSNINQEIPGSLTLAQFDANPRQTAAANAANDQGRNQRGLRGSLRTSWRLDEHTVFEGAVYAVWKDLDHPIFQVIDQQSRNYGAFGRLDWEGVLGGLKADAYLGAWYRQGDLDSTFYSNVKGARGALQSLSLQNAKAADIFAEGRVFATPHLALVGGLTWGTAKRDYRSFAVPGVATTFNLAAGKDYAWVSPRIGVLWQGDDGSQVFANITRSVEPPNFGALSPNNAGFAPVQAQEAWTGEVGARGHRGPFTYDVTLYRAHLQHELLQFAVDSQHPAATFNADKTVHQGIEAGAGLEAGPALAPAPDLDPLGLPLRRRRPVRRQPPADRAQELLPRRTALRRGARLVHRPVDRVVGLRPVDRLQEHQGRPVLRDPQPQRRLDAERPGLGVPRRPQPGRQGLCLERPGRDGLEPRHGRRLARRRPLGVRRRHPLVLTPISRLKTGPRP